MNMPKIYSEAYGCSANMQDSNIMLGLLAQNGFVVVDSPSEADLNLITACAVKTPTVNKMMHRIRELSKTDKPLVIAGCISKIDKERELAEKINPKASFVGPDAITEIVNVANDTLRGKKVSILERTGKEKANLPHLHANSVIDIVEINSGCLSNCAFCASKLARGNLFSYRPHAIREQIKSAVSEGCKEIWLTSQDSGAYGRDIDTNLADLLESVNKMDGIFFVRVGMMNPLHFKKVDLHNLIESYKGEKIFKFLHLCLQSGSNNVLKIMKRGYEVEDFVYYANKFRKEIPDMTLLTDIIVGHPGESDENFKETVKILKKVKPDLSIVSRFGSRPGTEAEKMKQIPTSAISERSKILHELVRKISLERNQKWKNWKGKILIDEKVKGGVQGRNFAYKSIVVNESLPLGSVVDVSVKKVFSNFLVGKIQ